MCGQQWKSFVDLEVVHKFSKLFSDPAQIPWILRQGTGAAPSLPAAPNWEGLVNLVDLDLQEPGESQWECAKSCLWGGILPAAMSLHIEICSRTWLSKAALCWTNLRRFGFSPVSYISALNLFFLNRSSCRNGLGFQVWLWACKYS